MWEEIKDMKKERASFEKKEAPLNKIGSSLMEGKELKMGYC